MNRNALLLGLLTAAFLGLVAAFAFVCDDAFISFRYARNWVEGHGLRYNLGEVIPVEGFSNLAWVVITALFLRLGLDVVFAMPLISTLCGIFLLMRFARWCREDFGKDLRAWLPPALLLALLPPMAVWSTSGLATMPFALALLVFYEGLFRRADADRSWSSLTIAALFVLTLRAEGFVWLLGLSSLALLNERRRSLAIFTACAAAAVLVLFVGRYLYFQEWLPLPVRIKSGLETTKIFRGAQYVTVMFLSFPGLLLGLSTLRRLPRASSVFIAANLLYAVAIGGDFMAMGRVLIPSMPLLILGGWSELRNWLGGSRALIAAALIAVLHLASGFGYEWVPGFLHKPLHFRWNVEAVDRRSEYAQWKFMRDNVRRWSLLGHHLAERSGPDDSVVLAAIGAVGYYSRLVVHDRVGLVSPEVLESERSAGELRSPGHDRLVEHRFFLSKKPRYLLVNLQPAEARARLEVSAGRLEESFQNYPYRAVVEPWGDEWVVLRLERFEGKQPQKGGSQP